MAAPLQHLAHSIPDRMLTASTRPTRRVVSDDWVRLINSTTLLASHRWGSAHKIAAPSTAEAGDRHASSDRALQHLADTSNLLYRALPDRRLLDPRRTPDRVLGRLHRRAKLCPQLLEDLPAPCRPGSRPGRGRTANKPWSPGTTPTGSSPATATRCGFATKRWWSTTTAVSLAIGRGSASTSPTAPWPNVRRPDGSPPWTSRKTVC
jgi:hypothetical protein